MYKLIRDNIAKIIKDQNKICNYAQIKNDEFYDTVLRQKLIEEVNEFLVADNVDNAIEEIIDIKTVLASLQSLYKISNEDFEKKYREKIKEKGAFKDRIIAFFPDAPATHQEETSGENNQ